MLDGLHPPVIPAPEDLMPPSGLCLHMHSCVHTIPPHQTAAHTHKVQTNKAPHVTEDIREICCCCWPVSTPEQALVLNTNN